MFFLVNGMFAIFRHLAALCLRKQAEKKFSTATLTDISAVKGQLIGPEDPS